MGMYGKLTYKKCKATMKIVNPTFQHKMESAEPHTEMHIPLSLMAKSVFKRSESLVIADYRNDVHVFNILCALDGKRTLSTYPTKMPMI